MNYRHHDSPLGRLLLAGDASGLRILEFESTEPRSLPSHWRAGGLDEVCRQLDEYFAGERRVFELQLAPAGTEFQREVWRALTAIPFGETESYAGLAAKIGRPKAMRAVGAANGANPLAIVVPCHRVIGRDGTLTGYAGGLDRKALLLRLEGWQSPRPSAERAHAHPE